MKMEQRKPTYTSAVRMAQLVRSLSQAWRPESVERLGEELGVSQRTLQRYRKALNEQLTAGDGSDFLKVVRDGKRELWYLSDQEQIMNADAVSIMSVFVAKTLLKFLEGTKVKDTIDDIWDVVIGQLKPSKKKQLESFGRKIRCSGVGRKTYEDMDIVLAAVLTGLIHDTKLKISHYSKTDKIEKDHIIHPYTLLLHRDALYLHAYVEDYQQIRTFTVDAIKEAVNLNEKFIYPSDYDPEKLTQGSFGIYASGDKEPFKVVVAFKEYLWEYITTRHWHPSQKFLPIKNGWFNMDLYISNTTEFIPWILAFGKEAKVLEPRFILEIIEHDLTLALRSYVR